MADEGVMDRPTQAGGGGRTGRAGRGGRGFEASSSGSGAGSPAGDDFHRLAGMLELIGYSLKSLIYLQPPLLPKELRDQFVAVWPETEKEIIIVVDRLRRDLPQASHVSMYRRLKTAGLAGQMLQMKEKSLKLHLGALGEAIRDYSPPEKGVLSLPEDEGLVKRLLKLVKPATKVMNSVIGSVPAVLFPGKEIVKEAKEHVEAGYEAAEISRNY